MTTPTKKPPTLASGAGAKANTGNSTRLLVSVPETCALLGLGARTVWSLTTRNALPHRRVGRRVLFSPVELEAWIGAGCPTEPGAAERVRKAMRAGGAR